MSDQQLELDQLHLCPRCDGTGAVDDPETGGTRVCGVCQGAGTVPYDPADQAIPY